MPLPIAHGLVGASIIAAMHSEPSRRHCLPLLVGAVLANCPDLDFALVLATHTRAWHRTFTHSLFFAFVCSLIVVALIGKARIKDAVAYNLAFTSHGLLDYATTKTGGGVELLWPFVIERFKLGLVGLSELPSMLSPRELMRAALLEFVIFAPLFLVVLLIRRSAFGKK